jgi:hypothetical protein
VSRDLKAEAYHKLVSYLSEGREDEDTVNEMIDDAIREAYGKGVTDGGMGFGWCLEDHDYS